LQNPQGSGKRDPPRALTPSCVCLFKAITCSPRTAMAADKKSIVVVKASLAKILCNQNHLAIYQDRVNIINRLVTTAYLFARYIFVHAYEDDENENEDDENDENENDQNENDQNENDQNENDNDAFNADVFMTDTFFLELLRSLQTRTRRASKDENTLRNR